MSKEPPTIGAVKCTYTDCSNTQDNDYLMMKHKYTEHQFYCKRCDYDATSWDEELDHRVTTMIPCLYYPPEKGFTRHFKHIVCEFCGEEFKSLSGRKLHQKKVSCLWRMNENQTDLPQYHQADQRIECAGKDKVWNAEEGMFDWEHCNAVFGRASQYMRHIEQGFCRFIKRNEVEAERQQKHIVTEIMRDPEKFSQNLRGHRTKSPNRNIASASLSSKKALGVDDDRDFDGIEEKLGGILLTDKETPGHAATQASLGLQRKTENHMGAMDFSIPIQKDPSRLDRGLQRTLLEGVTSFSVSSRSSSLGQTTPLEQKYNSIFPALTTHLTTHDGHDGFTSVRQSPDINSKIASPIWAPGNSNKTLFPNAKPNPNVEASRRAIQAAQKRSALEDSKTNLFRSHFWDPNSGDWNPSKFVKTDTGEVICPFVDCGAAYLIPADLGRHLRANHTDLKKQCKACYRTFKDLASLVLHFESSARGSKCRIARCDDFAKVLDEATGGFLSATDAVQEKVWNVKKWGKAGEDDEASKEDGDIPNGVKTYDYKAELPSRIADTKW